MPIRSSTVADDMIPLSHCSGLSAAYRKSPCPCINAQVQEAVSLSFFLSSLSLWLITQSGIQAHRPGPLPGAAGVGLDGVIARLDLYPVRLVGLAIVRAYRPTVGQHRTLTRGRHLVSRHLHPFAGCVNAQRICHLASVERLYRRRQSSRLRRSLRQRRYAAAHSHQQSDREHPGCVSQGQVHRVVPSCRRVKIAVRTMTQAGRDSHLNVADLSSVPEDSAHGQHQAT